MQFKKKIELLLVLIIILHGCNCDDVVLMHPKGQIGLEQRTLILIAISLMLIVVIPAIIMALTFAIKYRASNTKSTYSPNWTHSNKVELMIWSVPVIIIFVLAILTWQSTHKLDPNKSILVNIKPITIEVIALDWKWLFIYPEQNIATINEICFPVNMPVKFKITSNSVMNAFFIPQLGSQIYAMAGMSSYLNLIANKSGVYRGISSNFSGKGFSGMKFNVIVTQNTEQFNKWIKKVKMSPHTIKMMSDYERLSIQSEFHPVEYFSDVKSNLFHNVVKKFM